jgi:hypothetical protein
MCDSRNEGHTGSDPLGPKTSVLYRSCSARTAERSEVTKRAGQVRIDRFEGSMLLDAAPADCRNFP